jgi:putative ABC transport system permease protein
MNARLAALGSCIGVCMLATRAMGQQPRGDSAMGVAVERRFAEAARLHVGDTVRLSSSVAGSRPARVVAIYEPAPDPATLMRRDFHVRLHLADLAELTGFPDRVDRIGVVLRPGIDVDSAAARLNRTAFGYDVFPSRAIASQSSTTFVVVSRFHRAIAIISVLASTVFLLCLMLLKVEERRRDVAMLRFTGISRRTVFTALVIEAAVIALAGSIIGAGIGAVASAAVNAHYQRAFDTSLVFSEITSSTVCFAVGMSVVLGIVAGALAAWRMVRTAPVQLWSRAA